MTAPVPGAEAGPAEATGSAVPGRPDPRPYDALLVVSFGGPEKPEDVVPFLENVTRGRGIPRERLVEVGQHYSLFGGRSPINDLNRALVAALEEDFRGAGLDLPVYWGNRNWQPHLGTTLSRMRDDGIARAACLFTSAYSSYSGCRQYRESLAEAVIEVGEGAPVLDRLRHYFNHPGHVEPVADAALAALAELPAASRAEARLLFVTHSIPETMAEASGRGGSPAQTGTAAESGGAYLAQHLSVATEVAERVGLQSGRRHTWELVFCSRSGPPTQRWLEPDVSERIAELAKDGVPAVAVVPIGFTSDHMEVVYDLDIQARAAAEDGGMAFARAATAGLDPRFVAMVRDLLLERAAVERLRAEGREPGGRRAAVGSLAASWDVCPAGCCANSRGPRPALGGVD